MFDNADNNNKVNKKKMKADFEILIMEGNFLFENKERINYSDNFPPELVAVISAFGAGLIGIAVVFSTFSGLSGAGIMSALAAYGMGGAVGGITSIAATLLAPVAICGFIGFKIAENNKLDNDLGKLALYSYEIEVKLENDKRKIVINLLKVIKEYRNFLYYKYPHLMKQKS